MSVPTSDYDEFYGFYQPFVAAYVTRRIDRDDVADVVAEVFTVAWRRREVVPADALPWLYRTARNLVGNRYRSKARLAALREKLHSVPAEPSRDPAELAGDRQRLYSAFASLSDDDRELLLLVAWEGLGPQDIALVMDLSPGATAVRIHRARTRFDDALGSDAHRAAAPAAIDITAPGNAADAKKGSRP